MQIIRGDDYQSWIYSNKDDLVVVDPWLTRKQVFPRFNWLLHRDSTKTPYLMKYNLVKKVTHIIVTAHFSDHLDEESLKFFNKNIPIYTTHEASKTLLKLGFTNINVVTPNKTYELNSPYNTTTFSYLLSDSRSKIFHEPHMFNEKIEIDYVDACIVTVDMVKVLGLVQVSMDLNQAKLAQAQLNARYLIPTGIAPKQTRGLISFLLRIKESYKQMNLIPSSCSQVGDSLSL